MNVAKVGAKAYDMLDTGGEGIAVYETSDLKGKVEERTLKLRIGCRLGFHGGKCSSRAMWGSESTRSAC